MIRLSVYREGKNYYYYHYCQLTEVIEIKKIICHKENSFIVIISCPTARQIKLQNYMNFYFGEIIHNFARVKSNPTAPTSHLKFTSC